MGLSRRNGVEKACKVEKIIFIQNEGRGGGGVGGKWWTVIKNTCLAYLFISSPFLLFQRECGINWKKFKGTLCGEGVS